MTSSDRQASAVDRSPAGSGIEVTGKLRLVVLGCAGVAALSGCLGLLGWIIDDTALKQVIPGLGLIRANTAIVLMLLAATWFVPRRVGFGFAVFAVIVAALVLGEYATRTNFGIDQLLFTDHAGGRYPGRPSTLSAASTGLLGIARLLGYWGRKRHAQMAALAVLLVSSLMLLGYAYDVPSLYSLRALSAVALHTALSLLLLSVAALAAAEDGALSWAVHSNDAGALLVRRLLPLALIGLPLIGLGALVAQRLDWVDGSSTIAAVVVVSALVTGVLTWAAASRLSRVDQRRARAIAELTELKDGLERQVQDRVEQLQRRRDEIAVLEDRQRIAADLHDIVIQRLFAAGMFLQGTTTVETDPETRTRVNTAVEAMDTAIKDLRASIFELGRHGTGLVDLTTAIDQVCDESAHVLGFTPDFTVDDPEFAAETVRAEILAVVREALANVARHAGATRADVVLRTDDHRVTLTITDDGGGIGPAPLRSSGTRNMADRARQHGGDCTWSAADPHGTRVCWQVPVAAPVE